MQLLGTNKKEAVAAVKYLPFISFLTELHSFGFMLSGLGGLGCIVFYFVKDHLDNVTIERFFKSLVSN
jgi:hypothetical protein